MSLDTIKEYFIHVIHVSWTQCQAFLRRKIHRDQFDLNQYLCKIDIMMTDIFNARKDDTVTYDILDTKRSEKSKLQMYIWYNK